MACTRGHCRVHDTSAQNRDSNGPLAHTIKVNPRALTTHRLAQSPILPASKVLHSDQQFRLSPFLTSTCMAPRAFLLPSLARLVQGLQDRNGADLR
jgi:hypothetical protein